MIDNTYIAKYVPLLNIPKTKETPSQFNTIMLYIQQKSLSILFQSGQIMPAAPTGNFWLTGKKLPCTFPVHPVQPAVLKGFPGLAH